jgi:hypothetical protein
VGVGVGTKIKVSIQKRRKDVGARTRKEIKEINIK